MKDTAEQKRGQFECVDPSSYGNKDRKKALFYTRPAASVNKQFGLHFLLI